MLLHWYSYNFVNNKPTFTLYWCIPLLWRPRMFWVLVLDARAKTCSKNVDQTFPDLRRLQGLPSYELRKKYNWIELKYNCKAQPITCGKLKDCLCHWLVGLWVQYTVYSRLSVDSWGSHVLSYCESYQSNQDEMWLAVLKGFLKLDPSERLTAKGAVELLRDHLILKSLPWRVIVPIRALLVHAFSRT